MTGAEHYAQAEQLLEMATDHTATDYAHESYLLAAAQVHATLALASATDSGKYGTLRRLS
ncbi:MAG TPA: hypothetical protein VGH54_10320 [Mycobacterium sp.]|jgi:hypothetical protein|uniref:hypothetical protein n=1 Tax=Mycobacterium sp. TaxID=1785 RepID=UPI002F3F4559